MRQIGKYNHVIVADLHLNSGYSQPETVLGMLEFIERCECREIDLAGDVVDNPDLIGDERRIWDELVDLSDSRAVSIELGNHDDLDGLPLGQMKILQERCFDVNGRKFLVEHGHPYDPSLKHPTEWWVRQLMTLELPAKQFEWFYHHYVYNSSIWLHRSEVSAQAALMTGKSRGVDVVICGHTHRPLYRANGSVVYYNSGYACESSNRYRQSTLVTINDVGKVQHHAFSVDGEYQGIIDPAQLG